MFIGNAAMKSKNLFYLTLVLVIGSSATGQVPCSPSIIPNATLFVNWPQFQYDAAHTGCNPYESVLKTSTVGTLAQKWAWVSSYTSYGPPVIADGVLYGTAYMQPPYANGVVFARNASTGVSIWEFSAEWAFSSSLAVGNGMVYIGAGSGTLDARDGKTGNIVWQYQTNGSVSTPTFANGVVYVGAQDNNIYALNAATGALLWQYTTTGKDLRGCDGGQRHCLRWQC